MLGNDFVKKIAQHAFMCGECDRKVAKGAEFLISIKEGVVRKKVCSEECRLNFDDRIWQQIARKNAQRRKAKGEQP